ncbi:MAG: ABC transporter permease subunit [Bacteroidetes bacterium]|nr:ABC transporter permease subunit [Rhodothermia bacterium]MCX7906488.1 ABC transporter permease subunit [Bacteroidota bacterium]MDW8284899.1 ABC transporter permease subunit [Bacteroidota bacterium]
MATRSARWIDRISRWVITLGGASVIAAVLGILVFIFLEQLPLWQPARAALEASGRLPIGLAPESRPLAIGVEGAQRALALLAERPTWYLCALPAGRLLDSLPIGGLSGTLRAAWWHERSGAAALLSNTGQLWLGRIQWTAANTGQARLRVSLDTLWQLPARLALQDAQYHPETGFWIGRATDGALYAGSPEGRIEQILEGPVSAYVMALGRLSVHAAGPQGGLWRLRYEAGSWTAMLDTVLVDPEGRPLVVSALALLIGERSLVVGDATGGVRVGFYVRQADGSERFVLAHTDFRSVSGEISSIAPSARDRRFLVGTVAGHVALLQATSERTLLNISTGLKSAKGILLPRGDGIVLVGETGQYRFWRLHDPHPEVSLRTLFGRVWYEGYERPAFVWQSTGGSDDFEPKLSLVPLIFGTLKGTFYALLFAVPVALLGAIYTAQFLHPRWRALVKPAVEIMASLPSVVLGFVAAIVVAPFLTRAVPGVLAVFLVLPLVVVLGALLWHQLPNTWRERLPRRAEPLLVLALVLIALGLSLEFGRLIEALWMGGSFPDWVRQVLRVSYDQRNALVVGFAMGFAVIPIIFTLSEDALSSVPRSYVNASLALGATEWQTTLRVVLPAAGSGLFSAIMIGFGRAVGETMIVLMATGNTPILEWNPFTGFRALSANIAVELPEAPYQGTLYRVLFLSGLLLFSFTFLVNTAAELVRIRLRRKYQRA